MEYVHENDGWHWQVRLKGGAVCRSAVAYGTYNAAVHAAETTGYTGAFCAH